MSAVTIQYEEELELSPERAKLIAYRREQFEAMGFGSALAELMAERVSSPRDRGIDLGVARRLIAAGCPIELAEQILL
jgi:hypothetical protein